MLLPPFFEQYWNKKYQIQIKLIWILKSTKGEQSGHLTKGRKILKAIYDVLNAPKTKIKNHCPEHTALRIFILGIIQNSNLLLTDL